ncbi:MAG: methyltransferase domain-containing protein [Acetobacteraceae bacterium]|nr:methyltransferase domain-containing protein [Acetobacteraceae bacterium]
MSPRPPFLCGAGNARGAGASAHPTPGRGAARANRGATCFEQGPILPGHADSWRGGTPHRDGAPCPRPRGGAGRRPPVAPTRLICARFERGDAEALPFEDGIFDAAACALGLIYVPDPVRALREMRRVLRPGGKAAAAVWGARHRCGWAEIFPITDARVASEVCPMFFHLGTQDTLAQTFAAAGFTDVRAERLTTTLRYATADDALEAVFRGGPVALAHSRFDEPTRQAAHGEYLDSIAAHKADDGYRLPGEFVVAAALAPCPCVN